MILLVPSDEPLKDIVQKPGGLNVLNLCRVKSGGGNSKSNAEDAGAACRRNLLGDIALSAPGKEEKGSGKNEKCRSDVAHGFSS